MSNTRQATWIAVGNFFSFLVGIASPMILCRYFDKGDYGTYKQVMYVYTTLLIVFTVGLPRAYAYFIPREEKECAHSIIQKITNLFFILGLSFSVCLFFGAEPISVVMKNPQLEYALKIFSPVPLFILPTLGLEGIYASFQRTGYIALYTIVTRILTITCLVVPVVCFAGTYIDALIGFVIASFVTCVIALYIKYWPVRGVSKKETAVTYKQIFDFSLPLFYASIGGMVIISATQFFISRYYGNEVFADFSNGFAEIPFVGMIIAGISTVLLPVFSKMDKQNKSSDEMLSLWLRTLEKSAKLIFPLLIFSIFFAEPIVMCMYGDVYRSSGIYFQLKNFIGLIYIVPFAPILMAMGKTKAYGDIHIFMAFVIVVAEYICVSLSNSPIWVAVVAICCEGLKILLMLCVVAKSMAISVLRLIPKKYLIKIALLAVIAGGVTYLILEPFVLNKFIHLSLSVILFVACFYALCWWGRLSYRDVIFSLVPQVANNSISKWIP